MGHGTTRWQDEVRQPPATRCRSLLLRGTALQAAALLLLATPAAFGQSLSPNARPQGGHVVAGQASIGATPGATVITQSSQRAVLDWSSFNVGAAQSVQFVQPNAASSTFNRVLGPDPSQIAGRITANGQVVLMNQSGVLFTGTSQVNAQSLVVSTADISNRNAMAGKMVFDRPGKPNASVVNQGTITVRDTGLAALVAPSVANSGTIVARMGQVVLAGGTRATLDMYGDGLLAVDVTGRVQQVPTGAGGQPVTALVTNTGTILASGGHVTLTAAAVDGVVQDLVSAGGRIAVDNAGGAGGTVVVQGIGGSLTIAGRISATGATGGQIEAVATQAVTVADGARIDASGRAAGGTVALGTTLARATGGPAITTAPTARRTTIAAGARVLADATASGNGGRVVVLSTQDTAMRGQIAARGGAQGGNGGAVEVSGQHRLALTGGIDTSAAAGSPGSILIDPASLTIETGGSTTLGGSTLSVATLDALAGSVVLQATNSIEVRDAIAMTQPGASLSLQSGGNISVLAGIAVPGSLSLVAGLHMSGAPDAGDILLGNGVRLTAQRVTLAASQAGGVGGVIAVGGTTAATAGSRIDISGALAGGTLELAPSAPGAVQLGGAQPAAGVWIDTALPTGFVAASGFVPGTLRIGATTQAGGTLLTTATGIDVEGLPQRSGSLLVPVSLDLQTTGNITEGSGIGVTGVALLTGHAGGSVTLGEVGYNHIVTLGSFSAGGAMALTDSPWSGSLTLVGGVSATSLSLTVDGGLLAAGGGAIVTGTLTLATTGGGVGLTLPGNRIATLAGLSAPGYAAELVDGTALSVTGTVNAASVVLRAANLTITGGSSFADTGVTLQAIGSLDIAQAIAVTRPGGSLILQAGGDITVAAALQAASRLSLQAGVAFAGAAAAGNILLADGVHLTGPSVSLSAVNANGAGGTITVAGTATAGASAMLAVSGAVAGGTLELAPIATSAVQLGGTQPAAGLWATLALPTGFAPSAGYAAGTVRIGGTTNAAGQLVVSAGSITLAGLYLGAAPVALDLRAGGAISEAAGAGLGGISRLSGSAGGPVVLDQVAFNHIASVGDFTAGGGFTLDDAPVAGLALTGALRAAAITVVTTGGGLSLLGAITGGAVDLVADAGGIGQIGGSIAATTLSGSAQGNVALSGSANAIATLDGFSVGGKTFQLNDASPLDVVGTLTAGDAALQAAGITVGGATPFAAGDALVLLRSSGNITVQSGISLDGGALTLQAFGDVVVGGDIRLGRGRLSLQAGAMFAAAQSSIGGNVTLDGGALLVAGSIAIAAGQSGGANGQIVVPTGGSAAALATSAISVAGAITGGTLELAPTGPEVVQLGGGQPASGLLIDISVAGIVSPISASPGTLRVGAFSTAGGLVPTATSIDIAGLELRDSTGAFVPLNLDLRVRAGGGIVERTGAGLGGIATLTGYSPGAGGDILLTQLSANHIATLGALVAGGTVSVADAGPLTVTALAPNGNAGTVGGTTVLLEAGGGLTLGGNVAATSGLTLISQSGAIQQTAGSIAAATLTGSAAGDAMLSGTNRIAALGAFTAGGALSLNDAASLMLTGAILGPGGVRLTAFGGAIDETASGTITASTLTAAASGDLMLTGGNRIATLGLLSAGGVVAVNDLRAMAVDAVSGSSVALTTSGGNLQLLGNVVALAGATLTASGTISQPAGSLIATSLSGGAGGAVILSSAGNTIAALGGFAAQASFELVDADPLSVVGPVSGTSVLLKAVSLTLGSNIGGGGGGLPAASVTLVGTAGSITQTGGSIDAGTLSAIAQGDVLLQRPGNNIATLGSTLAAGSTLALLDSAPLMLTGPVSATAISLQAPSLTLAGSLAGADSVALTATAGGITQTGGGVQTVMLSVTASGDVALGQPGNMISTLGSLNVANSVASLDNNGQLVVGPVVAGTFAVATTGNLLLLGPVQAAGTVSLAAGGGILEGAGGNIVAGTLVGGAGGSASFASAGNLIGTLGSFSVGGAGGAPAASLSLTDGTALRLAGVVGNCNGDVTLSTTGMSAIAIGAPATAATLYASGNMTLNAPGGVTMDGAASAVAVQGAATFATPYLSQSNGTLAIGGDLTITGNLLQSGGAVATGGALSLGGTANVAGLLLAQTLTPALDSATAPGLGWLTLAGGMLATGSDLYLGNYALAGGNIGTLGTTGSVYLASLGIGAGGAILAGGTVAIADALSQTGGDISGAVVSVGAGPGAVAGIAAGGFGQAASAGSVDQTAGTLSANGALDLWSAGPVVLGGIVAAGGTLGVTGSAISQTGGILFARGNANLFAATGDASQSAGAAVATDVGAVTVQAPQGRNTFNDFATGPLFITLGTELKVSVTCDCAGPGQTPAVQSSLMFLSPSVAPGALASSAGVDVTLLGDSIGIDRGISARTLALFARGGITESATAAMTLDTLTGSVGVAADGALAPGLLALDPGIGAVWSGPRAGNAVMLTAGNSFVTLGGFAATGSMQIRGTAPDGTMTLAGGLTATGGVLQIDATGDLAVGPGVVVAGNAVVLTATGSLTVSGGAVVGGGVAIAAPQKTFDDALVVATNGDLALSGGISTVGAGSLLAAGGSGGGIVLDSVAQLGGSIAAAGSISVASLTQAAGVLAAGGDVALGTLQQASGTLSAGGAIGGQLSAATLDGSVLAAGDVMLASAGNLTITGTVAAGGAVSLTAASLNQGAGTVSGAAGVTLTATAGNAVQGATASLGGGGTAANGILVQALRGTNVFYRFAAAETVTGGGVTAMTLDCPRCADAFAAAPGAVVVAGGVLPVSAQPAAQPQPPAVVLSGASVEIAGKLSAGSLGLYASLDIGEALGGVLNVQSLTGSAGVANVGVGVVASSGASALFGGANTVDVLAGFQTAQNFTLALAGGTTVAGMVRAGVGGQGGNVALVASGNIVVAADIDAIAGAGAGGLLSVTGSVVDVPGGETLSGLRVGITAANAIRVGQDGLVKLAGSGQSGTGVLIPGQAGITAPADRSRSTTPGVFLTIGTVLNGYGAMNAATGGGGISLGAVNVSGGVLRLALPDNLAANRGNSGSIILGNVAAPWSDTILWIGNGRATGSVSARHLGVFYTGTQARATLNGVLYTPQGSPVTGTAAASLASVGRYVGGSEVVYAAQPAVSFGTCPVSSINCQIVDLRQAIPALAPVETDTFFIPEAQDDPDVLLPNIANQDY